MVSSTTSNKQRLLSLKWFKGVKDKVSSLIIVVKTLVNSMMGKDISEYDVQISRALKAINGITVELYEIDSRFSNFIDWSVLNDFTTEDQLIVFNRKRYKGSLNEDLSSALYDIVYDYSVLWRALDTLRIYFIYANNTDLKDGILKNQNLIEKRLKLLHPKAYMSIMRSGSYCDHSVEFLMESELIEKYINKTTGDVM